MEMLEDSYSVELNQLILCVRVSHPKFSLEKNRTKIFLIFFLAL